MLIMSLQHVFVFINSLRRRRQIPENLQGALLDGACIVFGNLWCWGSHVSLFYIIIIIIIISFFSGATTPIGGCILQPPSGL